MGDLLLGLSPVENDPNRLGQQYRRTKPRRQYNGTNTFVLMDALC